ncbi:50S ribosome-binding GTPase [bacterium]|nr:50S ribosome-binding GTPase [bacterium]
MLDEFLEKAEKLSHWIDLSLHDIKRNPKVFGDLELSGLELGFVLLKARVIPEVKNGLKLPVVAIILGGTNTGKSTLANSLAGTQVSPSGGTASFTKKLIGISPIENLNGLITSRQGWFLKAISEISKNTDQDRVLFGNGVHSWPSSLPIIIDTPDLDSSDKSCRDQAVFSLELCDIVIWVTTQQKYKDLSGIRFLSKAMLLVPVRFDVFNQALPRHDKALEDMRTYYDSCWPDNERFTFSINEQSGSDEKLLDNERLQGFRERLSTLVSKPRDFKARVISHGLNHAGNHFIEASKKYVKRSDDCYHLLQQVQGRFDEVLFKPIRSLAGHDAPFELQYALIRVLEPRLQSKIRTFLNRQTRTVGQAVGWAVGRVSGLIGSGSGAITRDPVSARDHEDLFEVKAILENAREDIVEFSRNWALSGHSLHVRFHEEVKGIFLPAFEDLERNLTVRLENGYKESLTPLITHFEHDLKRFCDHNPGILTALKVAVPGFSALAAVAAAAFSIHSFAIFPGVTEYFLGGIAVPIYQKLEGALPENLLNLIGHMANEPIIAHAKDDFAKTRRAIFFDFAGWLAKPIEELLILSNKQEFDPVQAMKELQNGWNPLLKEIFETS